MINRFGIILINLNYHNDMKSIFSLLVLALSICSIANAQSNAVPEGKAISFSEAEFDFGKIVQGKPVIHLFEWKNNSDQPVTITDVLASCGCTTPEWEKKEIAPGQSSIIKIGYNAEGEGVFQKTILVKAGNEQKTLVIKGNVYPVPATSAPLNPSIALFKQLN